MQPFITALFAAGAYSKPAGVVLLDSWYGSATDRTINIGTPDPRRHLVITTSVFSGSGVSSRSTPTIDGTSTGITEVLDYVNNAADDGHAVALYTVKKQSGTSILFSNLGQDGNWAVYAVYGANDLTTAYNSDNAFDYVYDEVTGRYTATNTTTTPASGVAFLMAVTNFGGNFYTTAGIDTGLGVQGSATLCGCDQFTESRTTYQVESGNWPVICSVVSFEYD